MVQPDLLLEAVVEPTTCSSLSGIAGRSETAGMTLLGRPLRPLPDIVLYLPKNQPFNTLNHLICMYFEFENAWLPIV